MYIMYTAYDMIAQACTQTGQTFSVAEYLCTNQVGHTGGIVADLVGGLGAGGGDIQRKLAHSVHGAYCRKWGSRTEP